MKFQGPQFVANWDPNDFHAWDTNTLIGVLSQIVKWGEAVDTHYGNHKDELDKNIKINCSRLTSLGSVILWSVLTFCSLVLAVIFWSIEAISFFKLLAVVAIFTCVILLIPRISNYSQLNKTKAEIQRLQTELDELEKSTTVWVYANADFIKKMKQLIPNYFANRNALLFMIQALQNHRAENLSQVINLWEQEKHARAQYTLQQATYASQIRTEISAQEAASAAKQAASSANQVSIDSMYGRNK